MAEVTEERDLADGVVHLVDDVVARGEVEVAAAARVGHAERLVVRAPAVLEREQLPA